MPESKVIEFNADIQKLMSLIINSLYSNKKIAIRELLANGQDALTKIRELSLTNDTVNVDQTGLKIQMKFDVGNKTLKIRDHGIGMTEDELIKNLGTIAHSGTKTFMESLSESGSKDAIGQFGVGFYSAYLVSDTVSVKSRSYESEDIFVWESDASSQFTVTKVDDETFGRGTEITLCIKDDMVNDLLGESQIKEIVKQHCEFMNYPIELMVTKTIEVPIEVPIEEVVVGVDDESDELKSDGDDAVPKVEDMTDETDESEPKTETKTVNEWEHLNNTKPIWTRSISEVTDEEHDVFYKAISNDTETYSEKEHFKAEGRYVFSSILYVPKRKPFSMFSGGDDKKKRNIKLYVRRVFITDDSTELIPEYLSFINGVVDSDDLPLNVSRELLQQNKVMRVIKKQLVKRSITMLNRLSESDEYKSFYEQYGQSISLGVHEDTTNREKLASLLRYDSSVKEFTGLDDYIERIKPSSEASTEGSADPKRVIYYITGESKASVENSPYLEKLKERNLEVLFLVKPIDEYCIQQLQTYRDYKLVCITKENLDLGDTEDEKKTLEEKQKESQKLCEFIKTTLGDKVEKVVVSNRLVDTPSCVVTGEFGWTANMERIMKAQALGDQNSAGYMRSKKTFEINPTHPIIVTLKDCLESDTNPKRVADMIWLLFESSVLDGGFTLDNSKSFTDRIRNLIGLGLDTESNTTDPLDDLPPLENLEEDGDIESMEDID